MDLRTRISDAVKVAMKARDSERLSTLRMMTSAMKNRDIEERGAGGDTLAGDPALLALFGKMVKQRQESAKAYRDGKRPELADKEEAEIRVIEEFLPQPMAPAEVERAVADAVADAGATGMKDMGKVMALLKERHTGTMDFGAAGPIVKARLG